MRTQPDPADRVERLRARGALATAVGVVVLLAACGDDDPAGGGPQRSEATCGTVEEGSVTIVAEDIAWDRDCLEAVEGVPFTVVVDNRDDGVNHDFRLTVGDDVLETPLEEGPVVQRLDVPALEAGRHPYICEIHPNMAGTLHVVAAPTDPSAG